MGNFKGKTTNDRRGVFVKERSLGMREFMVRYPAATDLSP